MTELKAKLEIRHAFEHGGYVRVPDLRKREENRSAYKKGFEMRFPAGDEAGEARLRLALQALGIRAGSAFTKGKRIFVPVHGAEQVLSLMRVVRATPYAIERIETSIGRPQRSQSQ